MSIVHIMQMQQKVAKKLMAAIAMLLVAAVLMGVTTYAWITFSTAPEINNIKTTVGGNGYLEIALQSTDPRTHRRAEITGGRSGQSVDAGTAVVEANLHWGNIVSLNGFYGLESMVLYPSSVYVDSNRRVDLTHPVRVPIYGPDGRLSRLDEANKARYTENGFTFNTSGGQYAGSDYGVNMLGFFYEGQTPTSTTVTQYDRKTVARDMQSQIETIRASVQDEIKAVMLNNSANIYKWMYYVLSTADSTLSNNFKIELDETDRQNIQVMLSDLDDIVGDCYEMLRYMVIAYAATDLTGYPDTEQGRRELGGLYTSYNTMTTSAIRTLATAKGYADIITAANAIDDMSSRIQTTEQNLGSMLTAVLYLLNYQHMAIDGAPVLPSDIVTPREHLLYGLKNGVYDRNGTDPVTNSMSFWSGSGVFSSLAELIGDYPSRFESDFEIEIWYEPTPGANPRKRTVVKKHHITTNIQVTSGASMNQYEPLINTGVLGNVSTTVGRRLDATTGTIDVNQTSSSKMTTYGYEVDLAFRTGEAGALKLQSEGVDRVYGMSEQEATAIGRYNEFTQGSGSRMTFSIGSTMTEEQTRRLIPQIYVVFVSTQSGTVYGIATGDQVEVNGTKATANLVLHEPLYDQSGMLYPGVVRSNQAIIPNMQADDPVYISVIVYLNGSTVDGSMLSYGGAISLDGSINLQFSNSNELIPMGYLNH